MEGAGDGFQPRLTRGVGCKQPIQNLSQTIIVEGSPAQARLQEGEHTTGLESGSHFVQDVVSIQNCSKQDFDPSTLRPHESTVAGLEGSKPSMIEATSNVRSLPTIKGK